MKTHKPNWRLVAQLGDADPVEYGGAFLFEDRTGVYRPEVEHICIPRFHKVYIRRFAIEPCTYINGILSDNPYYPRKRAWFVDYIPGMARSNGRDEADYIAALTGGDLISKAMAWIDIGEYKGMDNLDQYPMHMSVGDAKRRYASSVYRM